MPKEKEPQASSERVITPDFSKNLGYKGVPMVFYTIHQPGLPKEFDTPEGLRCIRTDAIESIFGHPNSAELNLSPGLDGSVNLDMVFVYDPNEVEIHIKKPDGSGGMTSYWNTRHSMEEAGWTILPAPYDRVVGYKTHSVK